MNIMPGIYFPLFIAIVAEVIGTTLLKSAESFTRFWPSVGTILCYMVAFYCLSLTLQQIPTGLAYAIWSGVGVVLISLVAWLWHGQRLDLPAIIGLVFIIAGVVIINTLSRAVSH
ncbi:QacE family quaternary ammonium compound efflux SMR transporter [Erwinia psidii]|uniref:QacE family quaternary ammonium compound efflux SMR transporter n=2 Tax=Erwinia psidii TaxID=69224 RepID=A0A3N6SJT2_9GAMM|nr:SMR family transporter [Erwinia psidii]MCX8958381.1 QacE family quaternary ammonium compound efflux SMR transporter [Erwinia psidii]MCX8961107.1 QacE family quaternary ammonium compound efflux SMR transporter [Erwinia psidii]MCX8965464.1 QacE family quaternary ammonium compound efflux SMR transporter [Erwinia psidii]RQM39051.1 QacE family quaternary ammonium compound efflux SMR transporter [Erwinia psidii]